MKLMQFHLLNAVDILMPARVAGILFIVEIFIRALFWLLKLQNILERECVTKCGF